MAEKKQIAQFILLVFITGSMIYLCWLMFQPFIPVILWSAILVIIFYPIYEWLSKKFKSHFASAIVTILISFLIFIIPMFLIALAVIGEVTSIVGTGLDKIGAEISHPQDGQIMNLYNTVNGYVPIQQFVKPEDLQNYVNSIAGTIFQTTLGLLGGVAGMVISVFFSIFTMFYLFRDGKKIVENLTDILPIPNTQASELINKTSQLIDATLKGTLLVAVVQGALTGLILWLLGVPSPILLGVLAMICSLLPVAGTGIICAPVILVFVFNGDYVRASIMTVFAIFIIGMVDNFLLPRIIQQRAKMNEIYVFFSVLGGLQLFGLLGIFMGPIILAIALGLLTVFKGGKISKDSIALE